MDFMVQAWLHTQTHTYTHTHTLYKPHNTHPHTHHGTGMALMNTMVQAWLWWTPWYRHGYDEHHGTGMAMMNTMVQAWLWWTPWYSMTMMNTMVQHGYDEHHGTGMTMMDFMVKAWLHTQTHTYTHTHTPYTNLITHPYRILLASSRRCRNASFFSWDTRFRQYESTARQRRWNVINI